MIKIKNLIISVLTIWIIMIHIDTLYADSNKTEIITINSIQEMKPYLALADRETLVIFDIDSTLTTPSDPYLQRQTIQRYKKAYKKFIDSLSENQYRIFLHLVIINSPSILVETSTPLVIKQLQSNSVKAIGYTGSKAGSLGNLPSFPDWRYTELKRLGIDFIEIFPRKVIFKEFDELGGDLIGFEKGIVYSGYKNSKGKVLPSVLNELRWIPKKIIVIDDKEKNVISLLDAAKKISSNIKCIGFYYKGIKFIPKANTDIKIFKNKMAKLIEKTRIICPE